MEIRDSLGSIASWAAALVALSVVGGWVGSQIGHHTIRQINYGTVEIEREQAAVVANLAEAMPILQSDLDGVKLNFRTLDGRVFVIEGIIKQQQDTERDK